MRVEILNLLADLEAGLDFVEEDIQFITDSQLLTRLEVIDQQLVELELQLHSRGAAHRPLELTLVGLPNAGKSSLFNALLGQDRSIASSQSGTTRDPVVAKLTLGELQQQQITLVDTAGLEPATDDSPRSLAQTMLHRRLQAADVVMLCIDLSQPPSADWIQQQMDALRQNHRTLVCIGTKLDLLEHDASGIQAAVPPSVQKVVSIHQQESIRSLLDFLRHQVEAKENLRFTEATHHTAVRFREAVVRSRESLDRARGLIRTGEGQELVASELHAALDELGTIIGAVHNDDILGQIFSRFCIGK
jgi:tRNA modification GTPase